MNHKLHKSWKKNNDVTQFFSVIVDFVISADTCLFVIFENE